MKRELSDRNRFVLLTLVQKRNGMIYTEESVKMSLDITSEISSINKEDNLCGKNGPSMSYTLDTESQILGSMDFVKIM